MYLQRCGTLHVLPVLRDVIPLLEVVKHLLLSVITDVVQANGLMKPDLLLMLNVLHV